MKLLHSLTIAAALAASAAVASAQTITLNSFGTGGNTPGYTYTAPTVTSTTNTATLYAGGVSYNVPTGGVWATALGASSWVSLSDEAYPGGTYTAPNGTYTYTTTFTTTGVVTGGSLEVLADDTTSVYLNGNLLVAAASPNAGAHCTVQQPNCEMEYTITFGTAAGDAPLSDFDSGTNTLTFGVDQDFGSATGLDFSGSVSEVAATPEPNTLVLLGTGILGLAGVMRKRFVA